MTAKLQTLITDTAETIVDQVDDCLLTTNKKKRVQKLLEVFASKLEVDKELSERPPTPAPVPPTPAT